MMNRMRGTRGLCVECEAFRPDVVAGQCRDCYWNALAEDIRVGALNRMWSAITAYWRGDRIQATYEMQMAWDRATNSGDYRYDGHFDSIVPDWRNPALYQAPSRKADVVPVTEVAQSNANDDGIVPAAKRHIAASGLATGSLLSPPSGPRVGLTSRRDNYPFE